MKHHLVVKAKSSMTSRQFFEWYEQKQNGLGSQFLDEVEKQYDLIIQNPEHYQSHGNQRIAVMNRFPYKIVYEVEKEMIVVYAVYHDKRDPKQLTERD